MAANHKITLLLETSLKNQKLFSLHLLNLSGKLNNSCLDDGFIGFMCWVPTFFNDIASSCILWQVNLSTNFGRLRVGFISFLCQMLTSFSVVGSSCTIWHDKADLNGLWALSFLLFHFVCLTQWFTLGFWIWRWNRLQKIKSICCKLLLDYRDRYIEGTKIVW